MRYFNGKNPNPNDDEYKEEVDNFFGEEDDDDEDYEDDEEDLAAEAREIAEELDLVNFDLNQKLLDRAIRVSEKTFLWRWRSHNTKLRIIAETYMFLDKLIQE